MNFPFTEVDYQGDDPTAPIIPTLGASGASATGLNRSTKSKKSLIDNQTNPNLAASNKIPGSQIVQKEAKSIAKTANAPWGRKNAPFYNKLVSPEKPKQSMALQKGKSGDQKRVLVGNAGPDEKGRRGTNGAGDDYV